MTSKLMGQCEWLKLLELAAHIPWLFLSCIWVRMIVLISSPSNFFLGICPCRLLVKKNTSLQQVSLRQTMYPHDLQLIPWLSAQCLAWCESTRVDLGNLIRRRTCQGDMLSLSRRLLLAIQTKLCALCFRCDPNCRFWRFCRLQAPKVKPSRWRRWAHFLGTETMPVPGCLGDGSLWGRGGTGYEFFCTLKPCLPNRDTWPSGLLWFDWS